MSKNNRKSKLEKALAFKADDTVKSEASILYEQGRKNENRRLALLHAALIEAIENLEDIRAWCRDRDASNAIIYAVCLSRSTEALAKIDDALDSLQLGPDCKPTRDESGT